MHIQIFTTVSLVHFGLIALWLFPRKPQDSVLLSKGQTPQPAIGMAEPTLQTNPIDQAATVRFWLGQMAPPRTRINPAATPQPKTATRPRPDSTPLEPTSKPPLKNPSGIKRIAALPLNPTQEESTPEPTDTKESSAASQLTENTVPLLIDIQDYLPGSRQEKTKPEAKLLEVEMMEKVENDIQNTNSPASKQAGPSRSILDSMAASHTVPILPPGIQPPTVSLQNGRTLEWKFDWLGQRSLLYVPRLQFSADILQGLEDQTVEIIFQIDANGKVVSTSFAESQLKAHNWQINSLLLEKVGQFRFEPTLLNAPNSQWLHKGKLSFHFSQDKIAPVVTQTESQARNQVEPQAETQKANSPTSSSELPHAADKANKHPAR